MNLLGKKNNAPTQKIFTDANLRKQQKEQYTQVYLCVYVQSFTLSNGVFKCKAKAVKSGQEVDNILGLNNNVLCIADFFFFFFLTRFPGLLYTVPY